MYAIIATGGKQYKVAEGDVIKVERLGAGADRRLHRLRSKRSTLNCKWYDPDDSI